MRTLMCLAVAWLSLSLSVGCDDGGGGDPDGAPFDGGADGDADVDGDTDTDADGDAGPVIPEMIDWYEPDHGTVAPRNRAITVAFANEIEPETLLVELNGEAIDVITVDNAIFRFVPLPLFQPDLEHDVAIVAGVTDVASNVLESDFVWRFRTEAVQVERTGDPVLTAEEVAHITAGDVDEPMELVTDWEDPESTLYDVSIPLDPTDPDVQHLVARMLVSVVHHGGIGLAAPQVGINRRLFVGDVGGDEGFEAFHNAVILAYAETTDDMVEGCLSIPGQNVAVTRPTWVEFEHDQDDGTHVDLRRLENPEGNPFHFPARVWFHEFDHLNGVLMTDRQRSLDR